MTDLRVYCLLMILVVVDVIVVDMIVNVYVLCMCGLADLCAFVFQRFVLFM